MSKIKIYVSILTINKETGEEGKLFLTIEFQPKNTKGITRVRKLPFATIIEISKG